MALEAISSLETCALLAFSHFERFKPKFHKDILSHFFFIDNS